MAGFKRYLDVLENLMIIVGVTVVTSMMVLTVVDVILRYTIRKPFFGTVEVTQFMLAILVFAGLALVVRDRSHIVVSLFEPFMLRRFPRLYASLFSIFNLAGGVVITWLMFKSGLEMLELDQRSLVLELPQGLLLLALGSLSLIAVLFGFEVFSTRPSNDQKSSSHDQHTDI